MNIFEIILILLILAALFFIAKWFNNNEASKTYVYPKNKHTYYVVGIGKMKNPDTGVWIDCVFYESLADHKAYCREYNDFYSKFVNIRDYKK